MKTLFTVTAALIYAGCNSAPESRVNNGKGKDADGVSTTGPMTVGSASSVSTTFSPFDPGAVYAFANKDITTFIVTNLRVTEAEFTKPADCSEEGTKKALEIAKKSKGLTLNFFGAPKGVDAKGMPTEKSYKIDASTTDNGTGASIVFFNLGEMVQLFGEATFKVNPTGAGSNFEVHVKGSRDSRSFEGTLAGKMHDIQPCDANSYKPSNNPIPNQPDPTLNKLAESCKGPVDPESQSETCLELYTATGQHNFQFKCPTEHTSLGKSQCPVIKGRTFRCTFSNVGTKSSIYTTYSQEIVDTLGDKAGYCPIGQAERL